MFTIIQNHFADENSWQLSRATEQSVYFTPKDNDWSGYSDCHIFSNGIELGRNHVGNNTLPYEKETPFVCHLGLQFIIDANFFVFLPEFKRQLTVKNQQVWRREGDLGMVNMLFPQSKNLHRFISLDFSETLLSRWAEDFRLPKWLYPRGGNCVDDIRHLMQKPKVMAQVVAIIAQPTDTLNDTLVLEAMTLALCAENIVLETQQKKNKIDDAIDIIKTDYHRALTIAELARRVGLNECYLKRDFKARTNKTIAQYIRDLRMQTAMQLLLDENKSVKEIAFYVGYQNISYFSKVFKSHFSVSPSELK